VPVAAWVGPNDARIAGAATALWSAAAVRFVGPGAEVRSTNPFDVGGAVDKVLAAEGGLVDPALTLRGSEAVDRGFAQSVKSTLFEVVKGLDGQVVNGVPLRIDPAGKDTAIRFANPDLLKRIRHTLATPWLAYLLLLVGAAALVFELFQPGFGPAGWSGLLGIALALVGLIALPTNWPMFALLAVGMTAMTYDVARGGLGALTWGGVALFGVGSWFLVHSHGSALRVPMWAVITGVLLALLYWVVIMTVVLRALRGPSADAGAALVGQTAEVRSTLNPQGHVLVDGALWRARVASDTDPVPAGTKVLVTGLDADALVLDVEQVSEPATASGSHS
jgi:membrane-bound serine protease (ClpP class)